MKYFICLFILLCGCNFSDYTEKLDGNYIFVGEGGCANFIYGTTPNSLEIHRVKKYAQQHPYIAICHCDSILPYKAGYDHNNFSDSDTYLIIDVKKNEIILNDVKKDSFSIVINKLGIKLDWLPISRSF